MSTDRVRGERRRSGKPSVSEGGSGIVFDTGWLRWCALALGGKRRPRGSDLDRLTRATERLAWAVEDLTREIGDLRQVTSAPKARRHD